VCGAAKFMRACIGDAKKKPSFCAGAAVACEDFRGLVLPRRSRGGALRIWLSVPSADSLAAMAVAGRAAARRAANRKSGPPVSTGADRARVERNRQKRKVSGCEPARPGVTSAQLQPVLVAMLTPGG
jgi:hypothetical protein